MAKSFLKNKAVKLRKSGQSVKNIAKSLSVSKSTASLWVRDVVLSLEQEEFLKQRSLKGAEKGRTIGSLVQKQRRLELLEAEKKIGIKEMGQFTKDKLKIAGLALYWAEGSKKNRRVELCNSDPMIIKFFINWLTKTFDIAIRELSCYVGINEAHKARETEVKNYWSLLTKIPLTSFTKTSFKKYPLKKEYPNFNEHYGTLSVRVRKPARIYYKILGEIHGLSMAT
ncbi:hypothetical protein A3D85_03025 [Candidatus Amesbacteria bacterium RIFCSPHIGHO2_02_FULL_47_9]|uniref:Resolvase HTH domain-containing protein n=1 Tax=Candidatus Amesbacteria bacterium RIFCSPHIGHO2_01_FULL_48_32b TaxID=1797253 RepID=A0A1F4YF08_9BACT|nr:MAG: hypothetical protein A2876_04240 [Candidatus Amesbacteria bacterium RIFCSPHIGHO2_01_FULL_48_32b]OGD05065.1 MAG: hypothetical protein A3D85_03025 [Candidatus Amesbacteria bacterium RIFCSPHIGHO2_02_FULL_47_9]OGD08607.1 MAG: hypothetical protein A2899_02510 [Candidatus Amesbacteria bacterium RIFCSPLOWO2_01_FULL_49_25]